MFSDSKSISYNFLLLVTFIVFKKISPQYLDVVYNSVFDFSSPLYFDNRYVYRDRLCYNR